VKEKAIDMFQAYTENKIPEDRGIIVQGFFEQDLPYFSFELTLYTGAKALYLGDEGITFQANALRFFVIVEPPGYSQKECAPPARTLKKPVPLHFNELTRHELPNGALIYDHPDPVRVYGLFFIDKPTGSDFVFIFPYSPDVFVVLSRFLEGTWREECGIPEKEASAMAGRTVSEIKKLSVCQA